MPRFRRLLRWSLIAAASVVLLGAIALGVLYFLIAPKLPDVETLRNVELQEPMYVYSRDGKLMALFGRGRALLQASWPGLQRHRTCRVVASDHR
jgi:penicillin-binding protein 1A